MKFIDNLKRIKPIEIFLGIVLVLYLIIPSETPLFLSSFINSPLGLIFLFIVTVLLFIYTNPILGVLYIIVAYELLRRSSPKPVSTTIMEHSPPQVIKDIELKAMNPPVQTSLEEEIIQLRAPIGTSSEIEIINSEFKPVSSKIISGSSLI